MQHYGGPFLEGDECVDVRQRYGVEDRLGIDAAYGQGVGLDVDVDVDVVHLADGLEEHCDVEVVDAACAPRIFLIQIFYDFFGYHRDMGVNSDALGGALS